MANSIANNHLSDLANKGRFGDTEVRIIDNDYAHVNLPEAVVIDEYGDMGKQWVKDAGAGTINPNTGLREYQFGAGAILHAAGTGTVASTTASTAAGTGAVAAASPFMAAMAPLAILGLGLQGLGMYRSGRQAEKSGQSQVEMLGQTEDEIFKLIGNLPALRESREDVALGGFEMQTERVGEGFTKAMDTLQTQAGQTDLVTPAGIKKKELEAIDTMESAFEGQEIGLRKSYADIGADYEKSLSEYQNKLKQVRFQKDLAQKKSEEWYLGKNIGGLFRIGD